MTNIQSSCIAVAAINASFLFALLSLRMCQYDGSGENEKLEKFRWSNVKGVGTRVGLNSIRLRKLLLRISFSRQG